MNFKELNLHNIPIGILEEDEFLDPIMKITGDCYSKYCYQKAKYNRLGNVINLRVKVWEKEEDKFLIDNYMNMDYEEIGKKLNRSKGAVKNRAFILREAGELDKTFYDKKTWTIKEEKYLIKNYGKISDIEIARKMGKTLDKVYYMIKKFKVKGKISRKDRRKKND